MLCTELSKVKPGKAGLIIEPLKCKRWSCDHCRDHNKKRVIAQAAEGEPTTFITLTIRPEGRTLGEQAARLVECWRLIRQQWAREHDGQKIPFIAIFERHPSSGRPHLHILCRAPFIPQRWISYRMSRLANSPVCDIRAVRSGKHAARYVSKYIGKDLHRFPGCKRYWSSHDYSDTASRRDYSPPKIECYVIREGFETVFAHKILGLILQATTVQNRNVTIDFARDEVRLRC